MSLKHCSEMRTDRNQRPTTMEVAEGDFQAQVLDCKHPVLVEFWTPWSRPCQVLDSVLKDMAVTCDGKIKIVRVNADDSLDLSLCYDIQSIPTLLYFVGGKPLVRIVGTASKEAILAKLEEPNGLGPTAERNQDYV